MSSEIFFTADTHFFHALMARLRGFSSTEEMNTVLIETWNKRVKPGDRVYHLGDFSLGYPEETAELAQKLNGQIYLVLGNHDESVKHAKCRGRFVWQRDLFYLKHEGQKVMLCHYAMRTWRGAYKGTWMLHGHSHGQLPENPTSLSFDVGADCWGLSPVSWVEVQERMARKAWNRASSVEGDPHDGHAG